jgi:hypothetical protein
MDNASLLRELKARRDYHEKERDRYDKMLALAQMGNPDAEVPNGKRGRRLPVTSQHIDWIKEQYAQRHTYVEIAQVFEKNFAFPISYGTVRNIIKGEWRGELQS